MLDLITIPKYDKKKPDADNKPCWCPVRIKNKVGEYTYTRPVIRCKCGVYISIDNHHIHACGRITGSYNHSFRGCEWNVFLKLGDWTGGEYKPGGMI